MFQEFTQGSGGSTVPPTHPAVLPDYEYKHVRHLIFGDPMVIRLTIQLLHKLNYAEPNDWSQPLPTGQPNEVMTILMKRVRLN
ncbi:MAG: hypothetical protein ACFB2W_19825 [Leptolyngbyaceae cyanobacterium]